MGHPKRVAPDEQRDEATGAGPVQRTSQGPFGKAAVLCAPLIYVECSEHRARRKKYNDAAIVVEEARRELRGDAVQVRMYCCQVTVPPTHPCPPPALLVRRPTPSLIQVSFASDIWSENQVALLGVGCWQVDTTLTQGIGGRGVTGGEAGALPWRGVGGRAWS